MIKNNSNNNNTSYLRKKISSTSLAFTAIALLLLAASPMLFFNPILLQPAQATGKNMLGLTSIKTPNPVALGDNCNVANAQLTFNAQGSDGATLTSGTFTVTNSSNSSQIWWSGGFQSASASGDAQDEEVEIYYNVDNNGLNGGEFCGAGTQLVVEAYCTQPPPNPNIIFSTGQIYGGVNGNVDCGYLSGTTAQPSMTAGSSQDVDTGSGSSSSSNSTDSNSGSSSSTNGKDSDSDGIPDSSDRCTHNSNPRCFKEGGDTSSSTTTTTQQEQPSSNRTGNQTR